MAVLLPTAAFDDLGHLRQIVHDIHPSWNLRAVFELRREHQPIIEPGITFQPIHRFPIFKGNLDQLGCDRIFALRHERREAVAGIVKCAGDSARGDADSVPAEALILQNKPLLSLYSKYLITLLISVNAQLD